MRLLRTAIFYTLIIAITGVTACKKDESNSPTTGPPHNGNAQRLVSVEFGQDSTTVDYKYEYTYDNSEINRIDVLTKDSEGAWDINNKLEYSYTSEYVEGVNYEAVPGMDTIQWEMHSKHRYRHDSQGRVTDFTFYDEFFFDYPEPIYRYSYHYEDGRLKERVNQRWSIDHFVDRDKQILVYDDGRLVAEVFYTYENSFWYINFKNDYAYSNNKISKITSWNIDYDSNSDTIQNISSRREYEYSGTKLSSLERFYYEDSKLIRATKVNYFYNLYGNIEIIDKVYDSGGGALGKEFYTYEEGKGNYRSLTGPTEFMPPEPEPKSKRNLGNSLSGPSRVGLNNNRIYGLPLNSGLN